jgi:hypothetical protein
MSNINSPAATIPAERAVAADAGPADVARVLLMALADMAWRSARRHADLGAALRGAQLAIEPARIRAALAMLLAEGCVSNMVPLSDGGMLLTVTGRPLGQAAIVSPWLPLLAGDASPTPPGEAVPN